MIIAQGKRGTSAALGMRHKMIPSLFSNLGCGLPRAAASAALPWAIILPPLPGLLPSRRYGEVNRRPHERRTTQSIWSTLGEPSGRSLDIRSGCLLTWTVNRDMKLHSILFGGSGFPTKPCVSPQVFHGSMRLMGCPEVGATVRGMKPSR